MQQTERYDIYEFIGIPPNKNRDHNDKVESECEDNIRYTYNYLEECYHNDDGSYYADDGYWHYPDGKYYEGFTFCGCCGYEVFKFLDSKLDMILIHY
jgi:hypothetical protein